MVGRARNTSTYTLTNPVMTLFSKKRTRVRKTPSQKAHSVAMIPTSSVVMNPPASAFIPLSPRISKLKNT